MPLYVIIFMLGIYIIAGNAVYTGPTVARTWLPELKKLRGLRYILIVTLWLPIGIYLFFKLILRAILENLGRVLSDIDFDI